jgi:DNA-binding MarR family transcriptional regulator
MAKLDEALDQAQSVADQFSRIMFRSMSERLVEELTTAEVTYPQLQALHFIAHHSEVTVGDISDGLEISYPSATNMIQRLVKKGLVEKCEDPRDRRAVQVGLSEHGTSIVGRLESERSSRFRTIIGEMEPEQRSKFAESLCDFIQCALRAGVARADELCLHCGSEKKDMCLIRARQGDDFCK